MITLPREYVVAKFYEYGRSPIYNKFNNVYQCSCPVCRESLKKKRCYFLVDKEVIYCHNCGWSSKPWKWIREVSGLSNQQIIDEVKDYDVSVDIVCQNSLLCREIEYVPKPFQNTKYYDPKAKYYFSSKTELSKKHDLFPFVNMMYYLRLQDSELEIYPIFGLSSNKIQEVYDLDRCIIN